MLYYTKLYYDLKLGREDRAVSLRGKGGITVAGDLVVEAKLASKAIRAMVRKRRLCVGELEGRYRHEDLRPRACLARV